jgi:hypothetical protein
LFCSSRFLPFSPYFFRPVWYFSLTHISNT